MFLTEYRRKARQIRHQIARLGFACIPARKARPFSRPFSKRFMIPGYFAQSASDWRMISSSSALESPPPKVNVPVRCRQSASARP